VEVFLPCSLTAREVRNHAYSTIRVIATEAGEFVTRSESAGVRQPDGWCKWSAQYLPAPPGVFREQVVE
jgi:hypothetical protein